ncbi:MAG: thiamine diphosphokinase, partial [Elusimicrobiaceae bacterium]|nr:thiamine diphosphokinase [Elusimicrobiaceae bacterium]
WVIGDLDSLPAADAKKIPPQHLIHIPTQENNDLEKALSFLVKKGVRSCTLAGITGGRFDFTLGNLLLLRRFARKLQLQLSGNGWDFFLLTHSQRLSCAKGARASLLPLTACRGVSLEGFAYPLQRATLTVGTTRTLSNLTTCTAVTVHLKSGILGVYLETKPQK